MQDMTIELADAAALPACLALLPGIASPETVVFAARDGNGVLAGAGGMVWRGWGRPAAMPAWVQVLPDCRRRGIGARLMQAMAAAAQAEGADLIAADPIDDESGEAAFARAVGATPDSRQLYFSADTGNFIGGIEILAKGLARRGRIPGEARVVPLADAPRDEVKWLVAQEMTTAPPLIGEMLSGTGATDQSAVDAERSCVMMVGDAVAGALLSRRIDGGAASAIICNVVAPAWRGGWVNVVLLERFTRRSIEAGVFRILFDCADDVRDTIGLARRSKADRIAVRTRFRYAVTADAADRRR